MRSGVRVPCCEIGSTRRPFVISVTELKRTHRSTWAAGNYAAVAELFETARRRASEQAVAIEWVEGDAEQLPFEDASFDVVLSAFGIQFAPRHEIVAQELARVCRPGGRIGLVSWTPGGQIGELFKIMGAYMPAPPEYASPPPLWGSEEHVQG